MVSSNRWVGVVYNVCSVYGKLFFFITVELASIRHKTYYTAAGNPIMVINVATTFVGA